MGKKIRGNSVASVLDELERLKNLYGIKVTAAAILVFICHNKTRQEILFVDDVFSAIPRRTLELCDGIVERNLDLTW